MAESPMETAERQRFVSILCRFPVFRLEDDEYEQDVIKEYERRSNLTPIQFRFHFCANFSVLGTCSIVEERGISSHSKQCLPFR
jgi:hypothetical protein